MAIKGKELTVLNIIAILSKNLGQAKNRDIIEYIFNNRVIYLNSFPKVPVRKSIWRVCKGLNKAGLIKTETRLLGKRVYLTHKLTDKGFEVIKRVKLRHLMKTYFPKILAYTEADMGFELYHQIA